MDVIYTVDLCETINYWIGLVLNALLVCLILMATRNSIGAYKYLQLAFIITNESFAAYSHFLRYKLLTKGHSFAMFLTSPYGDNLHLNALCGALFSLILVVISFNFLYRYMAVNHSTLIRLFSTAWCPLVLGSIALFEFAVWYAGCYLFFAASPESRADLAPEFARKYGIDAMTHAIVLGDYWRDGHYNVLPLVGLGVFCGIISAGFSFMEISATLTDEILVFCTVSILRYLAQNKTISAKTKRLQYALVRSLLVQTLIPFGFIHCTAGTVLFMPLFGIDIGIFSDFVPVSCSYFPPFDAIATILLMRDYRETVRAFLTCRLADYSKKRSTSLVTPAQKRSDS